MSTSIPSTMRAWQFSSTAGGMEKNLTLNNSAPSPPTALSQSQSLVEVTSMALNPVDYKLFEMAGKMIAKYPASPGIDFAGRIRSTSNSDLKPGQLVFGRLDKPTQFGTLGQFVISPEKGTVPLPTGVDPAQACCIGTAGLTAYQCIVPNVKSGDRVFINGGSGGTGTFGIQIAKTLGCHVTTSCSTRNVELCKNLGADEVIDYKSANVTQRLKEGGQQFTLVVDNIGQPRDLYSQCHHFVKPDGKFVQVGAEASMGAAIDLLSRTALPRVLGGGKRKFEFVRVSNDLDGFKRISQWMAEGKVRAIIDETFEFEDAPKAYEKMKSGRTRGKIVVKAGP